MEYTAENPSYKIMYYRFEPRTQIHLDSFQLYLKLKLDSPRLQASVLMIPVTVTSRQLERLRSSSSHDLVMFTMYHAPCLAKQ